MSFLLKNFVRITTLSTFVARISKKARITADIKTFSLTIIFKNCIYEQDRFD